MGSFSSAAPDKREKKMFQRNKVPPNLAAIGQWMYPKTAKFPRNFPSSPASLQLATMQLEQLKISKMDHRG